MIISNEWWSHPPNLSRTWGCGPLPVLLTFRGKEPFSRRGELQQERVIVPGPGVETD
jgi:hypothetical protein